MNLETFGAMSCDDAIKLLQELKKKNNGCKVVVTSFDFDKNKEDRKVASPDKVCVLVKNSNTVIINTDEFFPHMQLYSKHQIPENIVREGIMHDILLRIVS